jgi:hypothetical protein
MLVATRCSGLQVRSREAVNETWRGEEWLLMFDED